MTRYSSNTDKEMTVLKMVDLNGDELGLIRYSIINLKKKFCWITFLNYKGEGGEKTRIVAVEVEITLSC